MNRALVRGRRWVAVAVTALVLSSCSWMTGNNNSLPTPQQSSTNQPSYPAALSAYYTQSISWRSCRGGDQCGTLLVPLDYADPRGDTIKLSVLKVPATDPSARIGSLIVNPGGPGGSGVDYAANSSTYFGARLRAAFDIVGFDPRGVGQSDPVKCATDAQTDALVASDPDPDTPKEVSYDNQLIHQFGEGCLKYSGSLARHMSTVEAAKDMDILRAALGESTITYFGASYGTFLGATYAGLFPTHVGRMVLDGAIDPSLSTVQMSLVQAHGFEVALRAYVGHCTSQPNCFLGSTVDQGVAKIQQFLAQVDAHPLPTGGKRELQIGNAVLGIWLPLYNKDYWQLLDGALKQAFNGDGSTLLRYADAYVGRGPTGYVDNSVAALYVVNCLDHDDGVPSSQIGKYEARFQAASPTFGRIFAYGLSACANWPIHSGVSGQAIHAPGAPPIVVIGTTRDPATPLAWAQALAKELDSGVLITRNGDGHTGYHAGNSCVDNAVENYLVQDTVPKNGLAC